MTPPRFDLTVASSASYEQEIAVRDALIAQLRRDLARCFHLAGGVSDDKEDWQLAARAIGAVQALRITYDTYKKRIAELADQADGYF